MEARNNTMYPFDLSLENQFMPCECCRQKYYISSMTATATAGWKWSEEECKERILELAERLAKAKWYDRGDIRRQIKHWTEKLARYRAFKEEFK